jgi:hypothetical protein
MTGVTEVHYEGGHWLGTSRYASKRVVLYPQNTAS